MGKIIEINDEINNKKIKKEQLDNMINGIPNNKDITIIQIIAYDKENNPHAIEVGIEKLGNIIKYPLNEMPEIIDKLKEFGLSLEKHK